MLVVGLMSMGMSDHVRGWGKSRLIRYGDRLSWDVIQALGKYRKLHKLAIEDLTNTHNRTKVDW